MEVGVTLPTAADAASPTTQDLGQFRTSFRNWLHDNLPAAWAHRPFPESWPPGDDDPDEVAISREWHTTLYESGWIAPGWPQAHGGVGCDLTQRMVMVEELASARAPVPIGFQGIDILGPALIKYGSALQQGRYLPKILSARELWCQGYSEADSGSDLASMRTRADRDGDVYVVRGQKVWTSYGGRADWCFLLVRTGSLESRHRGITYLLVDMASSGVTWRPIRQVTGEGHFGELILEDVRVPVANRVGEEGQGWEIAMHSLAHERLLSGNVTPVRARLDALVELLRARGGTMAVRHRVAELETRLRGALGVQARALAMADAGDSRFPAWASMVKVLSTEIRSGVAEVASQILGTGFTAAGPGGAGMALAKSGEADPVWAYELLDALAGPIYAGTNEIQRNIIAELGLGLPR